MALRAVGPRIVGLGACAALVLVAVLTLGGTAALGSTPTAAVCVPQRPNQPVLSPDKEGKCLEHSSITYKAIVIGKEGPPGKEGKSGFSDAEQKTLKEVLPCFKLVERGIGGKPTIRVSGCNVQIVNGLGTTKTVNGAGNLVIGYDEGPGVQTGSHDLVLGEEQAFSSYAGIVGGLANSVTGPYTSIIAGSLNAASGEGAWIGGGQHNTASARYGSIVGGFENSATGSYASLSGGVGNNATGSYASVGGGRSNEASTEAWIGGGSKNIASGRLSAIFGGKELAAPNEYDAIPSCVAPGKAGELC